jgi:DNA polymerase-3 subunit beta
VLIETSGGKCSVTATDCETIASYNLECEGSRFAVLLPCARLSAIVNTSNAEEIRISPDGKITCGGSRFAVQTMDVDDFPILREEFEPDIHIQGLSAAVAKTSFATDPSSTRYALQGVHIRLDDKPNYLVVEATDGSRMAQHGLAVTIPKGFAFPSPVLIPEKPAKLIARIGDESAFACKFREHDMLFQCGNIRVKARMLEGRFPRTQEIVTDAFEFSAECVSEPLAMAATQALIMNQKDDGSSFGADFSFSENRLEINLRGIDTGVADIELPVAFPGEPLKIRLNPRYLLDYLRHVKGPVSVRMNGPDYPVVLSNGNGYRYVIMPQYVND